MRTQEKQEKHQTTNNTQQTTKNKQQTTKNKEQTTDDKQQRTKNKEQTTRTETIARARARRIIKRRTNTTNKSKNKKEANL